MLFAPGIAESHRWAGMLTRSALNLLWQSSPDALPDDPDHMGCCPRCCTSCAALAEMLHYGVLDKWVLEWPDGLDGLTWWTDANQVDREWLARAWANADKIGCHDGEDEG